MTKQKVAVAKGDGIGPEIMQATLKLLDAAGADFEIVPVELGQKLYQQGFSSGMKPETWDIIKDCKVLLKAPITTPQGGGVKSLNVTLRKTLSLYANVRPIRSYAPFVETMHPSMDLVIVRENEEDLYAGIEHRQTDEVVQCLKLISRPGSERIIRYAFEYAQRRKRKKLTCMTKDNIMKLTDGLFHRIFDEVAEEYPDIETEHYIIDIGMARVAAQPERFDVIVCPNLYGDIVSDVAAEVGGGVGMAGSANIGEEYAMFEAIHGSAPDIAGKGIANPSGLMQGAFKMLAHIGQGDVAEKAHNALLKTIEDGVHTVDIFRESRSSKRASTMEFADAVIERLGERPETLHEAGYPREALRPPAYKRRKPAKKELQGVDLFLDWSAGSPDELGAALNKAGTDKLPLGMITNRGVKVWPEGFAATFCTDHWRCRFQSDAGVAYRDVLELAGKVSEAGFDIIKSENLYTFDGEPGFSLGQGQ